MSPVRFGRVLNHSLAWLQEGCVAVAVLQEAVCSAGLKAEPCLVRLGTFQFDSQGRLQSEINLRGPCKKITCKILQVAKNLHATCIHFAFREFWLHSTHCPQRKIHNIKVPPLPQ